MRSSRRVIYTPDSPLRYPKLLLGSMWRDLLNSRTLAWRLIVRDISAQYRQTVLGYFWAILPPLVSTGLFVLLNKSQIINVHTPDIPYPIFVMTGTVFWQLFVDSLNGPLKEVATNRAMLSKIDFPKEALIISSIGQVLFSFLIKFIVLLLLLVVFQIHLKLSIIFIIIPIIAMISLGTLVGVLLVPVGVLYKDIQQGIQIFIQPLMLLTPVVFPPPSEGLMASIIRYNPISPMIVTARSFMTKGTPDSLLPLCIVLCTTVTFLFFGWVIYRVALPVLIERMDA